MNTAKKHNFSSLSKDEIHDIIQWDIENWKAVLPFWEQHFSIQQEMKVLVLGEREGGLSIYFAKKGCYAVCSDYIELPSSVGQLHQKHSVNQSISYAIIDMKEIPFPENHFDIVVFKSVLGALSNETAQENAIKEIYRVLKKGGALLFAENARASKLHQLLRKRYVKWNSYWRYPSISEFKFWCIPFSTTYIQTNGLVGLLGKSESKRAQLSKIDTFLSPITPKKWKYIIFGVAIK